MERFIRNKDLILKKIENITRKEEFLIAKLKDGKEQAYLVEPFLKNLDPVIMKLKDYDVCSLVMYNTKENLDIIVKNWDKIEKFRRNFSIYFVNPFSKTEKRWTVFPWTHSMLAGKGLKQGLIALFSNVEATTKEEIERIISNT